MKQRISARFYWQVRIPLISGCSFRTAAGGFIPPYRTAEELLAEPEDMTDKERKRLERIKAIPESVRELCQAEVANLRSQVMELEKRSDEIIDFLNGETV